MTTVRGLSWAHTRGHAPLVATARAWQDLDPAKAVTWEPRSLADFAQGGLAGAVGSCDLVVLDHPLIGEAVAAGWLEPLDGRVGDEVLAGAVGACTASYRHAGRQWAVPVDAAAQCSAWRPDLLATPPASWDDLVALAADTGRVATPLSVFGVIATFLSLVVQVGAAPFAGPDRAVDRAAGREALDLLARLAAHVPAWCHDEGAVGVYRRMLAGEAVYAAYAYGYSTYARAGYAPGGGVLRFGDPPPVVPGTLARPVLGGAGVALLRAAPAGEAALDYLRWVTSAACQRTLYTQAGGQPAQAAAWDDPALDVLCGGFLRGTRAGLDAAWVRPNAAWFARFQPEAGRALQRVARGLAGADEVLDDLDDLYRKARQDDRTEPT